MSERLEARDLTLRRGRREVLRGVSLSVRRGEVLAVVGPNGAGKSSLLDALAGGLRPASGTVRIDGADPFALAPEALALRRAVLEQDPTCGAPFTVAELAGLGVPRLAPPALAEAAVARALGAMELRALARRRLPELSGGERHRAHFARALAQLLASRALGFGGWFLVDEPTASLDLARQAAVAAACRAAAAEGAGVVAVVHDLTLAAALGDRVALLEGGRLAALGTPAEVLTPARLSALYGLPVAVTRPEGAALAVTPLFRAAARMSSQGDPLPCSSP